MSQSRKGGPLDMPMFRRLEEAQREKVVFTLDGEVLEALSGDTVMTAVLTHRARLRRTEFSGEARAGFCLIGACQDCWMSTESGARLRACSTAVAPGMRLLTGTENAP